MEALANADSVQISIVQEYIGLRYFWRDQMERGRRAFETAILYADTRQRSAQVNLRMSYAVLLARTRHVDEAKRQLEQIANLIPLGSLPLYQRAKLQVMIASLRLDVAMRDRSTVERLRMQVKEARAFIRQNGVKDAHLQAVSRVQQGGLALLDGELSAADAYLDQAHRISEGGDGHVLAAVHLMQARIDTARHDYRRALHSLHRAERAARSGRRDLLALVQGTRTATLARMEEYPAAYRALRVLAEMKLPGASMQHARAQQIYAASLTRSMQQAWSLGALVCLVLGGIALASIGRSIPLVYTWWDQVRRRDEGTSETSSPDEAAEAGDGGGATQAQVERRVWGTFDAVDDWTLGGDAGGVAPVDIDIVPRHPSVITPDRVDAPIPSDNRPVPRMVRPVLILERYRPDGTFEGLVGVPSWLIEEVLRQQVFVVNLGDTYRVVLRLREGTRTVLVSATTSGVRWQTVPLTVLGLPLYDLPPSETMTGE